MFSREVLRLGSTLGLAVAFFSVDARAGMQTYTASTNGLSATNILSENLSIPAFNPALGTLESVVVQSYDSAMMSAQLTNNSAGTANFTVSNTVTFGVGFDGTALGSHTLTESQDFSLATGGMGTFGSYTPAGYSDMYTTIDPTLLAAMTGTSPVKFQFSAMADPSTGGYGGNLFFDPSTSAGTVLSVTYNYFSPNIVPEPASLAMTLLGGLVIGAAGYARKPAKARATVAR